MAGDGGDQPPTLDIEPDEQLVDGFLVDAIEYLRIAPETGEAGQDVASLTELRR